PRGRSPVPGRHRGGPRAVPEVRGGAGRGLRGGDAGAGRGGRRGRARARRALGAPDERPAGRGRAGAGLMADRRQERKNPVRKPNSRKPELDPISNERDSVMRWSIRFKVLALAAVAALLLG